MQLCRNPGSACGPPRCHDRRNHHRTGAGRSGRDEQPIEFAERIGAAGERKARRRSSSSRIACSSFRSSGQAPGPTHRPGCAARRGTPPARRCAGQREHQVATQVFPQGMLRDPLRQPGKQFMALAERKLVRHTVLQHRQALFVQPSRGGAKGCAGDASEGRTAPERERDTELPDRLPSQAGSGRPARLRHLLLEHLRVQLTFGEVHPLGSVLIGSPGIPLPAKTPRSVDTQLRTTFTAVSGGRSSHTRSTSRSTDRPGWGRAGARPTPAAPERPNRTGSPSTRSCQRAEASKLQRAGRRCRFCRPQGSNRPTRDRSRRRSCPYGPWPQGSAAAVCRSARRDGAGGRPRRCCGLRRRIPAGRRSCRHRRRTRTAPGRRQGPRGRGFAAGLAGQRPRSWRRPSSNRPQSVLEPSLVRPRPSPARSPRALSEACGACPVGIPCEATSRPPARCARACAGESRCCRPGRRRERRRPRRSPRPGPRPRRVR